MTHAHRTVAVFAMTAATISIGCVHAYKPPTAQEPHAILKLRRTYETTAGAQLSETLTLGDERAFSNVTGAGTAATAHSDAILVHPIPVDLTFLASFSHQTTRQVQEFYQEREPYQATESYNCGTGTSYRSCNRSVTRYRSNQKTRWVTKTETVNDGTCKQAFKFAPRQGSTYLLQYTYQDRDLCALSCFEQNAGGDGTITQTPCSP
jgi:hypothetical protein